MRREILIAFALVSLLALFAAEGAIPATDIATTFENGQLIGCVGGTGFEVTDRRTGRTWRPVGGRSPEVEEIARTVDDDGTVRMTYVNSKSRMHWRAAYRVEKEVPEVVVTVEGEGEMAKSLSYPAAFATEKGDRLVVPMNEGISYPVDEPGEIPGRLIAYGGHGICMAFFGVQDDATGAGWMAILETPDDASMIARRDKSTGLWTLGPSWEDQKKRFGYARRVRYIFFDKGGYVAMCKRYRAYAKGIGLFKPFSEKAKERPLVDRLLGAANVWCWEKDKLAVVSNLVEAGIDRFLWSGGGTPEEVSAMAAMPKVLVGRYDCYQDVYYPDQLKKLGRKSGCNTEAWPHDIVWNSVDSNDWRHAWGVKAKDGANLATYGLRFKPLAIVASLCTALVTYVVAYAVLFLMDWIFKADFRIWTFAFKTFDANIVPAILRYLPTFLLFYAISTIGITVNTNTERLKGFGGYLLAIALNAGGALLWLILQYGKLFATGVSMHPGSALSGIVLVAMVPTLSIAAIISRNLYKKTGNIWTPAFLNALLMTTMALANTMVAFK